MITVKQYAEERGITIQAVHQSMTGKRKKERLEGHVHVIDGVKWLDEEAVDVLDEHRAKNPIVIIQQDKDETIDRLKEENETLLRKIASQADRIAELAQWKADNSMLIAGAEQTRFALEETRKEKKILEGFIQDAKNEIAILTDEKEREVSEARQETTQLRADLEASEEEKAAFRKLSKVQQIMRVLKGV